MRKNGYTLDDLRRDRAAYENDLQAKEEKTWAGYRRGFSDMRRLPAHDGCLCATSDPRPRRKQHDAR